MIIRPAMAEDKSRWNTYVAQHTECSPYHFWGWGDAITQAYGHAADYLLAEQDGEICGVQPLIRMHQPFGRSHCCALPFCDVGYPLADSETIRTALASEAGRIADGSLEIRDVAKSEQPLGGKVRMLLALPESADALWDSFKSKLRSQIRKAEKNGLHFEVGNDHEALQAFYQVFAKNMRDLGSPVHSFRWFEALQHAYGEQMVIGLVYQDEAITGAGILLFAGEKVSIPWASTVREYNRLAPNMLLYWNLLRISCERGCLEFDFGRSSYNEGTYKFKSQWGAKPVALAWQQWQQGEPKEKPIETVGDGTNSWVRESVVWLWQRLPLHVTTWLGPKIRKHISL